LIAPRIRMKSLSTQMLLYAANTNLGYCTLSYANDYSQTYLLGLSQNQMLP